MICSKCNTLNPDSIKECLYCNSDIKNISENSTYQVRINNIPTGNRLVCPYCFYKFKLNWKRYIKAIRNSKYCCPNCSNTSKLGNSVWELLSMGSMLLIGGVIAVPVLVTTGNIIFMVLVWVITGAIIALPVDKYVDSQFRKLEVIKKK